MSGPSSEPPMEVLVAGTAGGVGTTTVVALLFTALRNAVGVAPELVDHTAGALGARLADGDEVPVLDPHLRLVDLGRHASTAGVGRLVDPRCRLVVVTAATRIGSALGAQCLDAVAAAHGDAARTRTVVVLTGAFGPYRAGRTAGGPPRVAGGTVRLPFDDALAAGGRIPTARLSRRSVRALDHLVALLPIAPQRLRTA